MPLANTLARNNNPLDDEAALREHINRALACKMPDGLEQKLVYRLVKLWFRPVLYNSDRLPDRPCLFIGNHALFGLDGIVILPVIQAELGRFLRPMGDKFLFNDPRVGSALLRRGATMGHPEVARALMRHDQDILVFPGGAHEAVKPSHQRYQLQWKERLGFIRLAAEFGYPIVPFGLVGPDELYEYLLDSDEVIGVLKRLGIWSSSMREDAIPPLLRGTFGTPLPRPQASFLSFGEALQLPLPGKRTASKTQLQSWRDTVAERIDTEIAAMLLAREQARPGLGLLRRIASL
jgi:1-acyl-sn-glycerol-3-phosphate acyltransferase